MRCLTCTLLHFCDHYFSLKAIELLPISASDWMPCKTSNTTKCKNSADYQPTAKSIHNVLKPRISRFKKISCHQMQRVSILYKRKNKRSTHYQQLKRPNRVCSHGRICQQIAAIRMYMQLIQMKRLVVSAIIEKVDR